MKISGIYQIQSKKNPNRIYVGSGISIQHRWWYHLRNLKKGIHCNGKLQNHCNKYGIWKVPYISMEDSGEYAKQSVAITASMNGMLAGDYDGAMFFSYSQFFVVIEVNGKFKIFVLDGILNIVGFWSITPKNNQGFYRAEIISQGESSPDYSKGPSLMLRIAR
jgi:hypothetical protein